VGAGKTLEVLLATYAVWAVWLRVRPVVVGLSPARLAGGVDPFWLAAHLALGRVA
jgi:hypothetical protein